MTFIKDGEGTGSLCGVTSENRLKTASVSSTIEHHINHEYGKCFNLLFDVTPVADGCFIYLKNTSTETMTIEGIYIYVGGATEISIKSGAAGTRNGAVVNIPAVLNAGHASEAGGDFETGTDLSGAPATLNGTEVTMFKFKFIAETATKYFNFDQDIVVPSNQTLTLWSSQSVAVEGMFPFNYHSDSAYA